MKKVIGIISCAIKFLLVVFWNINDNKSIPWRKTGNKHGKGILRNLCADGYDLIILVSKIKMIL